MKKARPAIIFLALLVCPALLNAQWAGAYGTKGNDEAACVQQTPEGGFIVVGTTDVGSVWIVKLRPSGTILWQKSLDKESVNGYFVQTTRDNGYILTGRTSFGTIRSALTAWKLDAKGQTRWQTYIIDPDMHFYISQGGQAVQQTSDGGYVFTGYQEYLNSQFETRTKDDLLVCKSDSLGKKRWGHVFGGEEIDHGRSLQQTPDGGFIVAGYTNSFGAGDYDFWVLRLKSGGQLDWGYTYGGKSLDQAHEVRRTADGGYIVVGPTKSFGAGDYDLWLLKLNGRGRIQWQKTYGGPKADYGHSVYPTADGGFIVAGSTSSFGSGGFDCWILKLDSKGSIQWEKAYGGSKHDSAFSVRPLREGGYVAAGRTGSYGVGGFDVLVMKLGKNGNIDSSCGSFVRTSQATVLNSAGTVRREAGDDAQGSSSGLWAAFTIPLTVTKGAGTVICKK